MTLYELIFFLVHCLLHLFGYWLPNAIGACCDVLLCRPCRRCEKRRHGYAYHSAREVRLIHHAECTEAAIDVFGLMDVHASAHEDRQYCMTRHVVDTKEQEEKDVCPPHMLSSSTDPTSPEFNSEADTYNSQRYPAGQPAAAAGVVPTSPHQPAHAATGDARAETLARAGSVDPDMKRSSKAGAAHRLAYAHKSTDVKKEIKRCNLRYDAPLYGPHIGTIMGAFRCANPVHYTREEMTAWDGCYLAMDWYYVAGEAPTHYDHDHTSRRRKAAADNAQQGEGGEQVGGLDDVHAPFSWGREETKNTVPGAAALPSSSSQTQEQTRTTPASTAVGVVFIAPGLTSHSQTNYVQHLVHSLHAARLHVCVLSTRGMGNTPPLTTPFLFNGAYTRDVRDCLQHYLTKEALTLRFGRPLPLIGLGLSIGGIVLSKYVGEEGIAGADPHLDALISCCSPMDFVMTVEHMNRQSAQRAVYQHDMCNDIRNYILRHEPLQRLPNVDNEWLFAQGNIHRLRRVLHFDEHIIAKSAGYRSAHHYHLDASAVTWLPYAPIPTLTISAADDPVIGRTVMPHRWREMVRSNPRLVYAEPPVGGHLGFLGGPWSELMGRDNWLEVFVRDRVLAACAYWRAVQRHAAEAAPSGPAAATTTRTPAHPPSGAGSLNTPLPSPQAFVFSPTTAAVMPAPQPPPKSPAASAASTSPKLQLMRVVPARGFTVRGVHAAGREKEEEQHEQGEEIEEGAFTASSHSPHAAGVGANESAVPSSTAPRRGRPEPVLSDRSACSTSLPRNAKLCLTLNHPPVSSPTSASPRPIQYLPPREDRPTNRCYFTYYCTPAVPEDRLHQPYFSRSSHNNETGRVAASAEAGAFDDDGNASTSLAGVEDGRSSMYAASPSRSVGVGRRRGASGCGDDDDDDAGAHGNEAAQARGAGKDPRCMMVTGQFQYAPVVVNCDYVVDPRTLMATD